MPQPSSSSRFFQHTYPGGGEETDTHTHPVGGEETDESRNHAHTYPVVLGTCLSFFREETYMS